MTRKPKRKRPKFVTIQPGGWLSYDDSLTAPRPFRSQWVTEYKTPTNHRVFKLVEVKRKYFRGKR